LVEAGFVGAVCEGERCTVCEEVASAGCSDAVLSFDKWMLIMMSTSRLSVLTLLKLL
jgi:hypothetical protein